MLGNLHSAGLSTDISTHQANKKEKKQKKEKLLVWQKIRVSPWFVAHAEYVIGCANYYAC